MEKNLFVRLYLRIVRWLNFRRYEFLPGGPYRDYVMPCDDESLVCAFIREMTLYKEYKDDPNVETNSRSWEGRRKYIGSLQAEISARSNDDSDTPYLPGRLLWKKTQQARDSASIETHIALLERTTSPDDAWNSVFLCALRFELARRNKKEKSRSLKIEEAIRNGMQQLKRLSQDQVNAFVADICLVATQAGFSMDEAEFVG